MSDNSLPYLVDATTSQPTASYDHLGNLIVTFTARWKVGAMRPDRVEIYGQFGSDTALFDIGNRIANLSTDPSLVTISIPAFDRDPSLCLGVAPRTLENGDPTDTMVDASGDPQPWDQFAQEGFFTVAYPPLPPGSGIAPPNLQAVSIPMTLSSGDHIDVTVIPTLGNADEFHIIVNHNGSDQPQQDSDQPSFSFPSVPGESYAIKAQQKGVNFNGDSWSAWCTPIVIVANQRTRSLRVFLGDSGVLNSGVSVRQYAQNAGGSIRSMMGIQTQNR